jgi:DNA-binding response OmpR family regulator
MNAAPLKVLVVDDEPPIRKLLRTGLGMEGYETIDAPNAKAALELLADEPDLVILDLGLPDMQGLDLLRKIRELKEYVPVVVLSSRGDEVIKVQALDLGADDYVTKPFSPRELVARVRSVLRRVDAAGGGGDVLRRGDLVIDQARMQVWRDGTLIDLTPTEFQLVAALARKPGRILTRAQLLDAVRGGEVEAFDRAIDTHIKNIRRKIEPDSRRPRYVLTVYGMGYKFAE